MIRKHGAEKEVPDKKAITGCGTQVIETERLILRKFTFDDVDSMMRNWVADDEVQNNYGEPSYKTPEAVKGLLDEYIGYYQSGYYFRWAVTEKESGECIGQVAYFLVDPNNHFGEIEYCIGTAYQGKGYATEATRAIIKYGFEKIGFNKIQICARPVNIPSKRVIEKCGFKLDGVLPEYFCINGEYQDRMYFSLLKED
nr:GNAT family N-acetyltransferase [Ruminococcus sp. HUN007]